MMLKSIRRVSFLFAVLFTLSSANAFVNEACDGDDQAWSILTDSKPIPASSHWILHKGLIIRKDVLDRQQKAEFNYIPAWKAYEGINPVPTRHTHPKPIIYDEVPGTTLTNYSQTVESPPGFPELLPSENLNVSEPFSFPTPPKKHYLTLKLFHWHLSADTHSPNQMKRMKALIRDIKKNLKREKLMPDVFAFTGTHSLTGKESKERTQKYVEQLCKTLWQYKFNKEPGPGVCQMIKPAPEKCGFANSHIFWTEHMLVISMLPARHLLLPAYGDYENCIVKEDDHYYLFSSYLFLSMKHGKYDIPLMLFSSLYETIGDTTIVPHSWELCSADLQSSVNRALPKIEGMIIISHINVPYINYQDFANLWSARVRVEGGTEKELSLKNPLAKSFFKKYVGTDTKARRFSAVMSYRPAMTKMIQPASAHTAPDDIYLGFPGTRQHYLKWLGYTPLYPSYTEVKLDKAHMVEL